MLAEPTKLFAGAVACAAALVVTSVGRAQPSGTITPSEAKAMVAEFMSRPDAAKLGLLERDDPARSSAVYGPFVDPHGGRIRFRGWRVDPVKGTVLMPFRDWQVQGEFVNKGNGYTIVNARRVEVSRIKPEEAKAMLLDFLSGAEAAKMPPWVAESRKPVEASTPRLLFPGSQIHVGPWRVDPYVGTVVLPTDQAELNGSFEREGEKFVVKDARVREVRRIEPAEVKAMLLRFLATPEAGKFGDFVKTRELVEQSSPTVDPKTGRIYVGPWTFDRLTHEFRLAKTFSVYYGLFAKEGDAYTMFLVGRLFAEPLRGKR